MERFYHAPGGLPPAFDGQPLVFLLTVFSLLLISLLCLEWGWRLVWSFFERPEPWKTPQSALRATFVLLLLSVLFRVLPNVILLMSWGVSTPAQRFGWYKLDNMLDAASFVPFSLAWLTGYLASPIIAFQLTKQPIPLHLWPTFQQLKRPLKIGAGVFAIAFALAYLQ
jgi:hypothetical protein